MEWLYPVPGVESASVPCCKTGKACELSILEQFSGVPSNGRRPHESVQFLDVASRDGFVLTLAADCMGEPTLGISGGHS